MKGKGEKNTCLREKEMKLLQMTIFPAKGPLEDQLAEDKEEKRRGKVK